MYLYLVVRSRVTQLVVLCWQWLGWTGVAVFCVPLLVETVRDFPGHCSRVSVSTLGRDDGSD